MRKIEKLLLALSFLISLVSAGQCEKCSSFEEAKKDPLQVKSIIVNPYTTDITLDEFPDNIGAFTNCETLFLVGHNFTTISEDIGKLTKLRELSFAECMLTDVPDEIFQLKNLKELILWENPFSEETIEKIKAKAKAELPNTKLRITLK